MNKKLYKLMNWAEIEEITYGECNHPGDILGPHKSGNQTLLQAFFPGACQGSVVYTNENGETVSLPMDLADESGYFAVLVPEKKLNSYHYEIAYEKEVDEQIKKGSKKKLVSRTVLSKEDPYRFGSVFEKKDYERFHEGSMTNGYEKFGAIETTIDGISGIYFSVWAPNAMRISVVGDFNEWNALAHQMNRNTEYGIFELFIPEAKSGDNFKFDIKYRNHSFMKLDPFGKCVKLDAEASCVIPCQESFSWSDQSYMKNRKNAKNGTPMSIYQLDISSLQGENNADESLFQYAAKILPEKLKHTGYTHVELLPMATHRDGLGEEFRVIGLYSMNMNLGSLSDLKQLIDNLHKEHIGIIFDVVLAGFSPDSAGLGWFDGTCLYEHQDPRQGISPDLGIFIYNYGRGEVKSFLLSNIMYYINELHADGICFRQVARMLYLDYARSEWIPNMYGGNENLEAISFMKEVNAVIHKKYASVLTIAEDSSVFPMETGPVSDNCLGFDLKLGNVFHSDYLPFVYTNPMNRGQIFHILTDTMTYAYAENNIIGFEKDLICGEGFAQKLPGGPEAKLSNIRLSLAYMLTRPGKKLLGSGLTNKAEDLKAGSKEQLTAYIRDLNAIYQSSPALYKLDESPEGYEWIDHLSAEETFISFCRKTNDPEDMLLVVANFSGIEKSIITGVPYEGKYKEILNSDHEKYGGRGVINKQVIRAIDVQKSGRAQSITLKLAPLSVSILQFIPYTEEELEKVIVERLRRNTPIKKKK